MRCSPGRYTLYGMDRSFFTAKLESVLRYKQLDYHSELKTPDEHGGIAIRAGTHAIPVLLTPEKLGAVGALRSRR